MVSFLQFVCSYFLCLIFLFFCIFFFLLSIFPFLSFVSICLVRYRFRSTYCHVSNVFLFTIFRRKYFKKPSTLSTTHTHFSLQISSFRYEKERRKNRLPNVERHTLLAGQKYQLVQSALNPKICKCILMI